MAEILEAMLWERAQEVRNEREWEEVAQEMVKGLNKSWPTGLCTQEQSRLCAVALTSTALSKRFGRLGSKYVETGVSRWLKLVGWLVGAGARVSYAMYRWNVYLYLSVKLTKWLLFRARRT